MPIRTDCIDRHRNQEFLECHICSENEVFHLSSLGDIDGLSEKIMGKARKYREWTPHLARLGYLVTFTVHETCMNAVEHGLLGFTKEQKRIKSEAMEEGYLNFIDAEWRRIGTLVRVSVCMNQQSIIVGVHDDGEGFDYSMEHYSPMDDDDILATSGRGLLILKSLGVKLFWNNPGNTVLCSFRREAFEERSGTGPSGVA